jgi:hypothetical protein
MQRLCKQIPLLLVLLGLLLIALVLMIYRQRIQRIDQKIKKENRISINRVPVKNRTAPMKTFICKKNDFKIFQNKK